MAFLESLENVMLLFALLNPLLFGSLAGIFAKIFFKFLLWIYQFYRFFDIVVARFLEKKVDAFAALLACFSQFYITETRLAKLGFIRLFGGNMVQKCCCCSTTTEQTESNTQTVPLLPASSCPLLVQAAPVASLITPNTVNYNPTIQI